MNVVYAVGHNHLVCLTKPYKINILAYQKCRYANIIRCHVNL